MQPLLHPLAITVITNSQGNPYIEGQFITYTCLPDFGLTGPNVSVCTGNGEWEPDLGEVNCIGDNNYINANQMVFYTMERNV